MTARVSWHRYFLGIASSVASRSTCPRAAVGCVLVRDRNIVATGYNGSVRGGAHCTDVGCAMEDGHCVRTVHAETNAIAQAARNGARVEGTVAYVTHRPCWGCLKGLLNAGAKEVVYGTVYPPPGPGTASTADYLDVDSTCVMHVDEVEVRDG